MASNGLMKQRDDGTFEPSTPIPFYEPAPLPSPASTPASPRAWFMPPDVIDGEAWTREVAVVELGSPENPYWYVICPQATTLMLYHNFDRYPLRGNGGDDCSAAGCEWDKPHAWAKTVIDARRTDLARA